MIVRVVNLTESRIILEMSLGHGQIGGWGLDCIH